MDDLQPPRGENVTRLLRDYTDGDDDAGRALLGILYDDLREIARHHCSGGRDRALSIHPTLIVHEVYIKIFGRSRPSFRDRKHFLAVASRAMRQFVVDTARRRHAQKRGGDAEREPLDEDISWYVERGIDPLDLDQALTRLEERSEVAMRVFELHHFADVSMTEVGEILDISPRIAERQWRQARAWLRRELGDHDFDHRS